MTTEPKIQGWRVTRLSGSGYGKARRIIDAEIYNADSQDFWARGARERHSIEPLIRLTDHEAARAADKARIAELALSLRTVVGMLHHKATTPLERESIRIAEAAIYAHQSGGAK